MNTARPSTRPLTPDDVTPTWLTAALQSTEVLPRDTDVISLHHESLGGGTGVFGVLVRLVVQYNKPTSAPTHMVLKLPTAAPENKAVALALGIYVRETNFFSHLAARTPIASVHCLYSDMDIDAGEFVLILEEITHLAVGDQLGGANIAQLELALKEIAKWHAAWWMHPDLDAYEWLPTNDSPVQMAVVPDIMRAALPVIEAQWVERLGQEAVALGRDTADKFEEILHRTAACAKTLCHGDLRLENIFFDDDTTSIMFIDFQMILKATPAQDVQYLFNSSVEPDVWHSHGMRLLHLYHDELIALGVTDYTWSEFWFEFQLQCLWGMVAPASTVGGFNMGDEKGKQLAERWMMRGWLLPTAAHAREVL
ncbi:MAG: DUF1679 domain-containing protein [Ilumatobacteraceae bacterium]|nr:DUF1679 domain-containing protein [Ilumatobacteraceae bacterium]